MATLSGPGVHSGLTCSVSLHRSDGPVTFLRGSGRVPALAGNVSDTAGATSLKHGGTTVRQVEHLLAALHIRGWWHGLLIETTAEELPILDGSSEPWLGLLDSLGPAPEPPAAFSPSLPLQLQVNGGCARVEPGPARLTVSIDYPHPLIGRQTWSGSAADYGQLADARTFGFERDAADLRARGLALGASTDNCVVFSDTATVNPLRSADEPVRHKALDALGDLLLLGRPLQASVTIACGSHTLHARLVQQLWREAGLETAG